MVRSPDNKKVLQGVEELRARGWLEDGSLSGLPFCHAQLQGADLFRANLCEVDLHQAHLEAADLSLALLHRTRLARADLRRANFDRASLDGADLLKAKLQGAINLKPDQLSQANRLWGAMLPSGELYDGRYNLPGDITLALWGCRDIADHAAMADFYMVDFEQYLSGQREAALIREGA